MKRKRHFLVVEKDEDLRDAYRHLLSTTFPGCVVMQVESSEDACRTLDGSDLDAVVVNQQATDATGIEVVATIRKRWPTLPVVSVGDAPLEKKAIEAGATAFVRASDWRVIGATVGKVMDSAAPSGDASPARPSA